MSMVLSPHHRERAERAFVAGPTAPEELLTPLLSQKLKLQLDIELGELTRVGAAQRVGRIRDGRHLDEEGHLAALGLQTLQAVAMAGELQELLTEESLERHVVGAYHLR